MVQCDYKIGKRAFIFVFQIFSFRFSAETWEEQRKSP